MSPMAIKKIPGPCSKKRRARKKAPTRIPQARAKRQISPREMQSNFLKQDMDKLPF